jgi:hypothetical protein
MIISVKIKNLYDQWSFDLKEKLTLKNLYDKNGHLPKENGLKNLYDQNDHLTEKKNSRKI